MYLIESDRPADERLVDVLLGVLRTEEAVLQTVYRGQAAEWVPAWGRGACPGAGDGGACPGAGGEGACQARI